MRWSGWVHAGRRSSLDPEIDDGIAELRTLLVLDRQLQRVGSRLDMFR